MAQEPDSQAKHEPLGVTVRPGQMRDAATIAVFNLRMAMETERLRLNPSVLERGVRAALADPAKGRYLVAEAEAEGIVVGCLMLTREWSDWRDAELWWVQSVYVHADYRGRGVFRALYGHVVDLAREAGVHSLRLYVERHNEAAKKVYASLGFGPTEYEVMQHEL